MTFT
jgi:hypothetical protein